MSPRLGREIRALVTGCNASCSRPSVRVAEREILPTLAKEVSALAVRYSQHLSGIEIPLTDDTPRSRPLRVSMTRDHSVPDSPYGLSVDRAIGSGGTKGFLLAVDNPNWSDLQHATDQGVCGDQAPSGVTTENQGGEINTGPGLAGLLAIQPVFLECRWVLTGPNRGGTQRGPSSHACFGA